MPGVDEHRLYQNVPSAVETRTDFLVVARADRGEENAELPPTEILSTHGPMEWRFVLGLLGQHRRSARDRNSRG